MVEAWFSILTRKSVRRGSFDTVRALVKHLQRYIDRWNENPTAGSIPAGRDVFSCCGSKKFWHYSNDFGTAPLEVSAPRSTSSWSYSFRLGLLHFSVAVLSQHLHLHL
jgi:hypothetical protein